MTAADPEPVLTPDPPAPYSTFSLISRTCPECGTEFQTKSRAKLFCLPEHKLRFHNRCAARGKVLIPLAMAWRHGRGSGDTAKLAFTRMNSLLDEYNAEDLKAGRPRMIDFVESGFARWQRR